MTVNDMLCVNHYDNPIPGDFLQFSPSIVAEVERNFAVLDLPQRRSTRLFIGTTATATTTTTAAAARSR